MYSVHYFLRTGGTVMDGNDCLWIGQLLSKLFSRGYEFSITIDGETLKSSSSSKQEGGSYYHWNKRLTAALLNRPDHRPDKKVAFRLSVTYPKQAVYRLDYNGNKREYCLRKTEGDITKPLNSFARLSYEAFSAMSTAIISDTPSTTA